MKECASGVTETVQDWSQMDLSKTVAIAALVLVVLLVAGYTFAEDDTGPQLAAQAVQR